MTTLAAAPVRRALDTRAEDEPAAGCEGGQWQIRSDPRSKILQNFFRKFMQSD